MNSEIKYLLKSHEGSVIGYFQDMKYYPNKTLSPSTYDSVVEEDGSLVAVSTNKPEGLVDFSNLTYTRHSDGKVFQLVEEKA